MATTLLKLAAKVAIGGGAVFVTIDQGVWSNSSSGRQALDRVQGSVFPSARDMVNQVPSLDTVNTTVLNGWNSGIKSVFTFASSAPDTASKYTHIAVSSSMELVQGK